MMCKTTHTKTSPDTNLFIQNSKAGMVGGSIQFQQAQKPKSVAASSAAQFKLITVMAAVTADWLTNHVELNTNMNNHTIQS